MLKVWGRRSSFNLQKVMWLVGELGLPTRAYSRWQRFRPQRYTRISGHESTRTGAGDRRRRHCCLGVADDPALSGSEILARPVLVGRSGRTFPGRALDGLVAGDLAGGFSDGVFWGFSHPEAQRNLPAIAAKVRACAGHFQLLDRILADRLFLCGDTLTLADIPAGTSLYRYFGIEIERPSIPNVEAWYRRLQERPAYREYIMVPFGELHGKLDY